MVVLKARTPSDFLFTYRGLLIDHEKTDARFHELIRTKDLERKRALTQRFIVEASGKDPQGDLTEAQNAAFNQFFGDPTVHVILPIATADNLAGRAAHESAPGPNDFKFIYQAMFASDSTSEESEFGQFERHAHKRNFEAVEEQFKRLYAAQTGKERHFKLTDEQCEALLRLTSDEFIELRPFEFQGLAVY